MAGGASLAHTMLPATSRFFISLARSLARASSTQILIVYLCLSPELAQACFDIKQNALWRWRRLQRQTLLAHARSIFSFIKFKHYFPPYLKTHLPLFIESIDIYKTKFPQINKTTIKIMNENWIIF